MKEDPELVFGGANLHFCSRKIWSVSAIKREQIYAKMDCLISNQVKSLIKSTQ